MPSALHLDANSGGSGARRRPKQTRLPQLQLLFSEMPPTWLVPSRKVFGLCELREAHGSVLGLRIARIRRARTYGFL